MKTEYTDVFKDLFTSKPVDKIKKIDLRGNRKNKHGISRYICSENVKSVEKLPNELRVQFRDNLHSRLSDYNDSYCGLYATE